MPWWCSGLAYSPVEAVTRVQSNLFFHKEPFYGISWRKRWVMKFPAGAPKKHGPIAQSGRAPAF